jgi:tRNA (guanine-N7-)-methyltransferase
MSRIGKSNKYQTIGELHNVLEVSVKFPPLYKDKNFIGIDIKGTRIHDAAIAAAEAEMTNVFFVRTYIECLDVFFPTESVSEIWIPFPDPFPTSRKRRLTSPGFVEIYKGFLKPEGIVHLKTDNGDLYEYTMEVISQSSDFSLLKSTNDLYKSDLPLPVNIQTYFEKKFLLQDIPIKYCSFIYKGDKN